MRARTNHRRIAALALGAVMLAGIAPVHAADIVYEEPPAPQPVPIENAPVASWIGPYLGVYSGYGFGGQTQGATGGTISTNGWLFGGFAGYNLQSGSIVYGLEGDIGYNGMNGGNGTTYSRQGLEGSLRARLGYSPDDAILLYATAGGAATAQRIYDAAGTARGTALGWTAGAGMDAKLTDNVFGRVEYRYTDFGSTTLNTGSGAQTVSPQNHRIMVGAGLKF
ncbi:MAG: porin family protein [Brucellaceae bacterium]|nr:porin family protein [Brucellaceae bacterium]